MSSPHDTIAAIATPMGEAGLGVIRVSGSKAIEVANGIFHSPNIKNLQDAPSHSCHFGTIIALPHSAPLWALSSVPVTELKTQRGQGNGALDQVVLTLFRAPHSYTGDDVVEISAHGSPFILQEILNLCLKHGARLAGPGEFTQRAFLNGKLDLTQAEAVAELIRAKTQKTQCAAMAQLQGRLASEVRALRNHLLPLLAHVEVGLDHSDEDHDFLRRRELIAGCQNAEAEIGSLLASARVGKILRDGLRVALIGRPNVGKSSLLNALLKEERAIVTPLAGTTRDTLEESVDWEGLPVVLTDTAGLRQDAGDAIERLGMERTQQALEQADVLVGLFDGSDALTSEDEQIVRSCREKPHVWAVNKSDLPEAWTAQRLASMNGGAAVIPVSAKTGAGLPALIREVKSLALGQEASSGSAQWLLNARHRAALEKARGALAQAREAAQSEAYEECVALELRAACQALGEIIGETTTEDLLGEIFKNFCVGK